MITKKKLIPILIFTLSGFSILRLLKISTVSLFSSPAVSLPPTHPHTQGPSKSQSISSDSAATLAVKEFRLLSNLVSLRAPCNLLIFGLEQEYLNLSRINAGGKTVFLEDNPEKLNKIEANYSNTQIYKVEYQTVAKDAYKLLEYARQNPACGLQHSRSGSLKNSSCPLALTRLPREVYKRKWDMVVVDGPRGDTPDAPGRMTTIYTASLIARSGNMTDVVVHDVDRMIEKWFAWEFLCDENLVSSKGKLDAMTVLCAPAEQHAFRGPIHPGIRMLPFITGRYAISVIQNPPGAFHFHLSSYDVFKRQCKQFYL